MIELAVSEIAQGLRALVGDGSRIVVQIDIDGNCVLGKDGHHSRKMGADTLAMHMMHAKNLRLKAFYDERHNRLVETFEKLRKIKHVLPHVNSRPQFRVEMVDQGTPDARYEKESKFLKDLPVIKIVRPTEYAQADVDRTKKTAEQYDSPSQRVKEAGVGLYTAAERAAYAEAQTEINVIRAENASLVKQRQSLSQTIDDLTQSSTRWKDMAFGLGKMISGTWIIIKGGIENIPSPMSVTYGEMLKEIVEFDPGATTNSELVKHRDALVCTIEELKRSDERWREEAQRLSIELALKTPQTAGPKEVKEILSKMPLKMERQSRGRPIRGTAHDFMVDDDIEFRCQPPIQHRDFVMEHMNVPFRMPGRFLDLMPSNLRIGLRVHTVKVDGRPSRNWKRWAKQERKFGVDGTVVEINRDHSGNSPDFVVVEHDCGGLGYYHLWEIELI
jgi:FtsZ-binding cell division protein ZapB